MTSHSFQEVALELDKLIQKRSSQILVFREAKICLHIRTVTLINNSKPASPNIISNHKHPYNPNKYKAKLAFLTVYRQLRRKLTPILCMLAESMLATCNHTCMNKSSKTICMTYCKRLVECSIRAIQLLA